MIPEPVSPPLPRFSQSLIALLPTLALMAVLWSVSSWGYYALVEALSFDRGYDDAPFLFASYYLVWTGIAFAVFRPVFSRHLLRRTLLGHAFALIPILAVYATFVAIALPLFPEVSAYRAPLNPPEFMFASAWYYLPKSVDILFQQVLVAALVLRAHHARLSLRSISVLMAVLFGGFHLTLALEGFTPLYVARFTVAASLFGLLIPWLYLRTRHGFRWAYGLHWGFYALDAAVTHLVLAVPPWVAAQG